MRLAGLSARNQEAYVQAVGALVARVGKPPLQITEDDIRQHFLDRTCEQRSARGTVTIALRATKRLFEGTLKRRWTTLSLVRPAPESKLPVVLSREEVAGILALVRIPVCRTCFTTIYGCGLRLMEGARLQRSYIDTSRVAVDLALPVSATPTGRVPEAWPGRVKTPLVAVPRPIEGP